MQRPLSKSVTRVLRQRRWSDAEARIVLDAVATSELTIAEFARAYEVDYQRLNAWRRRLTTAAAASEGPLEFVELRTPTPAPAATPRYEIQFPSGEILRLDGSVDVASVGSLLALLRGGPRC